MKKISVIVPIYNVEKFLQISVQSIVSQTYRNLEIILINDGSTDNCGKMCDAFAKQDNRIIVVHKENAGLSSARNTGMDIATGDYITSVDSDDFIHPQTYEIAITVFEKVADVDFIEWSYQKVPQNIVLENKYNQFKFKPIKNINLL